MSASKSERGEGSGRGEKWKEVVGEEARERKWEWSGVGREVDIVYREG